MQDYKQYQKKEKKENLNHFKDFIPENISMLDKFFVSLAAERFRLKYTPVNLRNYSFMCSVISFVCTQNTVCKSKITSPMEERNHCGKVDGYHITSISINA